jgi:hypothetical protein
MIQALNYIPALCYGPGVYFSLHMGAASVERRAFDSET